MLTRLEKSFGIKRIVLQWFQSYLKDREQTVVVDGVKSAGNVLKYGVPQGSVLGPVLFTIYTQPLARVLNNFGLKYHFYADDSRIYGSCQPENISDLINTIELAEIKGILKIRADESSVDDGKTGAETESNESSRSEFGFSRREKKKVTFDDSFGADPLSHIRFQPSISTEPLRRMKAINSMNDFPKKQLGHLPKLKKLPNVGGDGAQNSQEGKTEPKTSSSSTCKHYSDLRCANCVLSSDTERATADQTSKSNDNNIASQDSQVSSSATAVSNNCKSSSSRAINRNAHPTQALQLHARKDKAFELPREPLKKYKPLWVKTFTPLQRRRQYMRLATRQKYSQRQSISKNKNSFRLGETNPEMTGQVSEDFSKLQVSGDGKMMRSKLQCGDVAFGLSYNRSRNLKIPKNSIATSTNQYDGQLRPFAGPLSQYPSLARGTSAPGRLRKDGDNDQNYVCMDKTSQILSWLDDVRSKSHFKSRNSRIYASGPTDLL
ncbi:reverse transcriptase-like protein [Elysia marginata]|uniref:Reverse transcriptase-like protein n=1 Tax=Elysia marginata TaxID=1093978 RepID=A0AAV4FN64_9GAST|nr:reverse transcriptase-like protein [Elysia marginata]